MCWLPTTLACKSALPTTTLPSQCCSNQLPAHKCCCHSKHMPITICKGLAPESHTPKASKALREAHIGPAAIWACDAPACHILPWSYSSIGPSASAAATMSDHPSGSRVYMLAAQGAPCKHFNTHGAADAKDVSVDASSVSPRTKCSARCRNVQCASVAAAVSVRSGRSYMHTPRRPNQPAISKVACSTGRTSRARLSASSSGRMTPSRCLHATQGFVRCVSQH